MRYQSDWRGCGGVLWDRSGPRRRPLGFRLRGGSCFFNEGLNGGSDVANHFGEFELFEMGLHFSRLDFCNVQNVVDKVEQILSRTMDFL